MRLFYNFEPGCIYISHKKISIHFNPFSFAGYNSYFAAFCYSNAILQYLADQYDISNKLYPKAPKLRAIVNHRLCFNLALYYRNISEYTVSPIVD